VGADFGLGLCCGSGCGLSCSLGFSCCFRCWSFSCPLSCVVSACCEASSPPPSILVVLSLSFPLASWPGATPVMTVAIMFVMPSPHSVSSTWRVSHFCSLSCIDVIIPRHCAFSRAACASSRFVRCPTVWCSCVSSCACCGIDLSVRLFQALGTMAVARASLLLLRILFLFLSIGSTTGAPEVSAAQGVAAVAISLATPIGTSIRPSPASPVFRSLLPLTLALVITPVRQTSPSRVGLVVACRLADMLRNRVFCENFTRLHSIVWVRVRALLLQCHRCWDAHSGVNSMSRIYCRCPFRCCYRCCRLIVLFLFAKTFVTGLKPFPLRFRFQLTHLSTLWLQFCLVFGLQPKTLHM